MARYDFKAQRLLVEDGLAEGAVLAATPAQANYLVSVLRLKAGDSILLFNGRDGEWRAEVTDVRKRGCALRPIEQTRPQEAGPDIHYLFAPLKRARLDYMVEKATEMGVARLQPVLTRYTQAERVNLDRMRSNAIEAAEQCGILRIPEICEPVKLDRLLGDWPPERRLIFCDEAAEVANPIAALRGAAPGSGSDPAGPGLGSDPAGLTPHAPPLAVLIGPEGGFAPEERAMILGLPAVTRLSMGPRIMRADTAAIAALALVNATLGDWR